MDGTFASVDLLDVPASPVTHWLFALVTTTDGVTGLGEASVPFGGEVLAMHLGRYFEAFVRGASGSDVAAVVSRLRGVDASGELARSAAVSSLEQAVLDAAARSRGVATAELLGGVRRDRVRVYANINRSLVDRSAEGFARAAARAARSGFAAVKCAPFDGVCGTDDTRDRRLVAEGLQRLTAVRSVLPESVELLVDCHGRLNRAQAVQVARAIAELGITWFEEPLATHPTMASVQEERDHPDGRDGQTPELRGVLSTAQERRHVADCAHELGLRIAGGEFLYGANEFAAALTEGTVDILMPDVKYCGGAGTAIEISRLGAARGAAFAPHNPSGPVALAVTLQVCAAARSFEILELQVGEQEERARRTAVSPVLEVVGGELAVPAGPGHGVSLSHRGIADLGGRLVASFP